MSCQRVGDDCKTIGYMGTPVGRSWGVLAGILAEPKKLTDFLDDEGNDQFVGITVDDSSKLFVQRADDEFTVAIVTHGHGAPLQKMWGALKTAAVKSIRNVTDHLGTDETAIWPQMAKERPQP